MNLLALLDLLAPPLCAGCGASAGESEPLCSACRRELRWLGAKPIPLGADDGPPLVGWAPVAYEGPARGLVRALKFKGASRAAGAMAAHIAANAPLGWLDGSAALVPVPLHPARRRKRGYNQAERLATALAARSRLELHDCLERAGPRGTQIGRDRAQRLTGIAGRVHVATQRAPPPPPQPVILIDDVITTGATLAACADALRAHGTADVRAIAYARTPGR